MAWVARRPTESKGGFLPEEDVSLASAPFFNSTLLRSEPAPNLIWGRTENLGTFIPTSGRDLRCCATVSGPVQRPQPHWHEFEIPHCVRNHLHNLGHSGEGRNPGNHAQGVAACNTALPPPFPIFPTFDVRGRGDYAKVAARDNPRLRRLQLS